MIAVFLSRLSNGDNMMKVISLLFGFIFILVGCAGPGYKVRWMKNLSHSDKVKDTCEVFAAAKYSDVSQDYVFAVNERNYVAKTLSDGHKTVRTPKYAYIRSCQVCIPKRTLVGFQTDIINIDRDFELAKLESLNDNIDGLKRKAVSLIGDIPLIINKCIDDNGEMSDDDLFEMRRKLMASGITTNFIKNWYSNRKDSGDLNINYADEINKYR